MSTVLVTPMPYWAERAGTPRTLAVAYPFGHPLGFPGDAAGQLRVIRQALDGLASAREPGVIVHSAEVWPEPAEEAKRRWQPAEASPIVREMAPKLRDLVRQMRLTKEGRGR